MATIKDWNNLNFSEIFEIYPLIGTELIWLIFIVVYWLYWHFKLLNWKTTITKIFVKKLILTTISFNEFSVIFRNLFIKITTFSFQNIKRNRERGLGNQ